MFFIIQTFYRLVYLYSIILGIYALLSWFPGAYQTSFGQLIIRISEPILKPFRRLNLHFAGLDFTVWLAILALNMLARFLGNFLLFILY